MPCRRNGFSLVELLVVIAIIGLLVSLLLPAVQSAREAGRRTQCQSSLKQLGLAIHNYESTHKVLPPAGMCDSPGGAFDPQSGKMFSWQTLILAQLEQQNLRDQFDFGVSVMNQPNNPQSVQLEVLMCPSDSTRSRMFQDTTLTQGKQFAKGNYAAFVSPFRVNEQRNFPGVLTGNATNKWASVTDGLSNTFMISEVKTMITQTDQRGAWALAWNGASILAYDMHPDASGKYPPDPTLLDVTTQVPNNNKHPNADVLYNCDQQQSQLARMPCFNYGGSVDYLSAAPRSNHFGVVNVAYADGHVDAVQDEIDPMVMGYLIGAKDGQSVSNQ